MGATASKTIVSFISFLMIKKLKWPQIGLSASAIASSFGKTISDNKELSDYNPEDISLALLRMISYNIGQVIYLTLVPITSSIPIIF